MLERSYPLMTPWRTVSFPLIGFVMSIVPYLALVLLKPDRPGHAKFFLYLMPVMVLIMLGPVWGFGGRVVLTTGPGAARVRRDRWLSRGEEVELRPRPSTVARLYAVRSPIRRHRKQGSLWAEVDGTPTRLVMSGMFDTLERIAAEINAQLASQ